MSWQGPEFVIAIIAISTFGWIVSSWIRAKHGYPLEDEWNGKTYKEDPQAARRLEALDGENAALKRHLGRLEERMAVLERIATDPAERTAREIESLR
ncbi:MAG TPA: hypothetical protein VE891_09495 [Allosphingosinicella sp.]|nr:hypothetical protein [Allosphingosinicella sp.]